MQRITNSTLVFAGIFLLNLMCNFLFSQNRQEFQASDFAGEPIEEVKLQTDRAIYLSGESIWFNACCFINSESVPSPISQIIYIEIYNAGQKVFLREKFKLQNGNTSGNLAIPEETPTGYYFIRAYTMYLRNFPPENYFISSLTIVNPELPQSGGNISNEIKMIPEGGNLISGIPSYLALKIPPYIVHKTAAAFLTNNKGKQKEELNVFPNGLCMIKFTPLDTVRYFLKLRFFNGDSLMASIPHSLRSGILVQTKIVGNKLHVMAHLPDADKKYPSNCKLKVLSESYHQKYTNDIVINQQINETVIPLTELPHGLSYVVLTDKNDSILSFNPVYLENSTSENIQLSLQKNTFITREKVELNIQLPSNSKDFNLMTVAVVKKGTAITMEELLPDVVIENPCLLESYLEKNFASRTDLIAQLNIALMLYSRSALNNYLNVPGQKNSDQIFFPEIRDVSISGFLLDKKTQAPIKNAQMFLSVLFEDFQLHTTKTMDDGSFVFSLDHLTGKHNLYLLPDTDNGGEHELFIHNDFSTQFRSLNECIPLIDSNYLQLLEQIYVNRQISDNFPRVSVDQHEVQKLSPWFGVKMTTVKLADYIDLSSFREVINEIVPAVRLKNNDGKYRFTVFDDNAQITYEKPLVLLDNIPVTDINELIKIHPALIEKIEVMNQPYIIGNYTIWGLILITTKTNDFAKIKFPEESAFLNYQTRRNSSSFVPLDFHSVSMSLSPSPFFNTVLYWDALYDNDTVNRQIYFFTSDQVADYDVIVRGKSGDGILYHGFADFSVTDK